MTGYLTLSDGRTAELHDGLRVGRGSDCELVLHDRKASRHHVRFIVEAGVVEVEDLDSSNGTFLNGKAVTRRMLRPGDKLQIGTTVLEYHEGTAGAAASGGGGAGPAAAVFDDDDELFAAPAAAAPAGPASPPPPAPTAAAPPPPSPTSPAVTPPPPSPPARPAVVEFADEIVEVRHTAPRAAASAAPAAAPADAVVETGARVLQYSKNAASRSVLGDDVAQLSGGTKALVFVLVLVGMAALAWAVIAFVR